MNCQKCGTKFNLGENFCRGCGAQIIANPIHNVNQQNNDLNNQYGQSIPNQNIDIYQNSQSNIQNNQFNYSNDEILLEAYIGNNAEKIMKGGFSTCTFFFGMFYALYRKMYLLGITWLILSGIVNMFLPTFSTYIIGIANIAISIMFNNLYIKNAKKEIEKIKNNNPTLASSELERKCRKKGGTSIGVCIISIVLLITLIVISVLSSSRSKLVCTSNNGNITLMYNDDAIIGYVANGITYDLDEQKAIAEQLGLEIYIDEFTKWFETNTSGTCKKEEQINPATTTVTGLFKRNR